MKHRLSTTEKNTYIHDWMGFLNQATSPFHAVEEVLTRVNKTNIPVMEWYQSDELIFDRIYTVKGEGSLIIFYLPAQEALFSANALAEKKTEKKTGSAHSMSIPLKLWGSHTDSPTLKLKPNPTIEKKPYELVSASVYGGPILNTWLDRPLAIAGKIFTRSKNGSAIVEHLVDTGTIGAKEGLRVVIPNAAIHLNREINNGFKIIADTHLRAIYDVGGDSNKKTGHGILGEIIKGFSKKHPTASITSDAILSHELLLYDPTPAMLFGKDNAFINSRNLDNLAMVHAGLSGWLRTMVSMLETRKKNNQRSAAPVIPMLAFFNHEEIGSNTFEGAGSHLFIHVYDELYKKLQEVIPTLNLNQSRAESLILSADMTHGYHPNYENWHEEKHRAFLNHGPVIKHNVNYRYAGSGNQIAQVKRLMEVAGVPIQEYVHPSEIPCGSTIGPVLSSRLAMPTVDIGNPLLAMHSTRESAGVEDHLHMIVLAENFFKASNN